MALLGARALLLRGRLLQSRSGNGAGEVPARGRGCGRWAGSARWWRRGSRGGNTRARTGGGEVREEVSARGWGGWACSGSGEPGRGSERGSESIGVSEEGEHATSARLRSSLLRKAAPPPCAVGSSRRETFFFSSLAGGLRCSFGFCFFCPPASRHALLGRRGRRLGQQAGSGRGWLFSALRAPLGARHGSHPRVRGRCGLRPVQVRATATRQDCKPRASVQPWLRRGLAGTFKSST